MGIVVFNPTAFQARYPEFAMASSDLLSAYFNEACCMLDNTNGARIRDLNLRSVLLSLLTAHIAKINSRDSGAVGRVSQAKEGSVSTSLEMGPASGSKDWFTQTQYGAQFWQMTLPYRSGFYVPPTAPVRIYPSED
jgi:Protein of unknown function (DUF4054)